jgi:hypothetical protein
MLLDFIDVQVTITKKGNNSLKAMPKLPQLDPRDRHSLWLLQNKVPTHKSILENSIGFFKTSTTYPGVGYTHISDKSC